jgi:hypothetical protein
MFPQDWTWLLISAIAGGFFTALFLPFISHFTIRSFNHKRVAVRSGTLIDGKEKMHKNLPLIVTNNSYSSIKNVVAFLTIGYDKDDIKASYEIDVFNAETPFDHQLTLSWSKQLGDRIVPYCDINQGESADLNLFRIHPGNQTSYLEIPSENGFSHKGLNRTGRLLLDATKNYNFSILITADNITPIRKSYIFHPHLVTPRITEMTTSS